MTKILRLLLNRKVGSSSDIKDEHDRSHSVEVYISDIENSLQNWSIPKQILELYTK